MREDISHFLNQLNHAWSEYGVPHPCLPHLVCHFYTSRYPPQVIRRSGTITCHPAFPPRGLFGSHLHAIRRRAPAHRPTLQHLLKSARLAHWAPAPTPPQWVCVSTGSPLPPLSLRPVLSRATSHGATPERVFRYTSDCLIQP